MVRVKAQDEHIAKPGLLFAQQKQIIKLCQQVFSSIKSASNWVLTMEPFTTMAANLRTNLFLLFQFIPYDFTP